MLALSELFPGIWIVYIGKEPLRTRTRTTVAIRMSLILLEK